MEQGCRNLTVDELLQDGVTRAVMRADRVDPEALEAMLRGVAARIAANMPASVAGRQSLPPRHERMHALPDDRSNARSGCLASLRARLPFQQTP